MKKQKENVKANSGALFNKKIGKPLKDVVPSNNFKNLRENNTVSINKEKMLSEGRNWVPYAVPFSIMQELLTEDEINISKDILSLSTVYEDPTQAELSAHLPLSYLKALVGSNLDDNYPQIKWLRIEDCIKNYIIDKQIREEFPKKDHIKMRMDIREKYEINIKKENDKDNNNEINEDEGVDVFLAEDDESRKKIIYKEFYKILEKQLDLKVVTHIDQIESDDDFKKRKEKEYEEKIKKEESQKLNKKTKPSSDKHEKQNILPTKQISIPYEGEKITIKHCSPCNISLIEILKKNSTCIKSHAIFMSIIFCKWIASVLQLIIDLDINDAHTGRSIWCNIYPQKGGIPVYSPYGKYVVKLYFMGKPRLVEIDDRIPTNVHEEYLFPKSEEIEEIWPFIFTKALMKLHAYKARHPYYYLKEEHGDSSVIYALTGYISEDVSIYDYNNSIKIIEQILSDDFYINKKKYLICVKRGEMMNEDSGSEKEKLSYDKIISEFSKVKVVESEISPTLSIQNLRMKSLKSLDETELIINHIRDTRISSKNNYKIPKHLNRNMSLLPSHKISAIYNNPQFQEELRKLENNIEEKPENFLNFQSLKIVEENLIKNNLYYDYAYSVTDFFDNGEFNMNRLKPLDFSDLKQKIKDEANSSNYKQLSKADKRIYKTKLRELMHQQKEIKLKRIEDLKKDGNKFNLVKIKNESHGAPLLNFMIDYSEEKIYMAKKCLINRWSFPPPSFFGIDLTNANESDIDIVNNNETKSNFKKNETKDDFDKNRIENVNKIKKKLVNWNKDVYRELINDNIDQFTESCKNPVIRKAGGIWINYQEMKNQFDRFIILHHPLKNYNTRNSSDNNWYYNLNDFYEPDENFNVYLLGMSKDCIIKDPTSSVLILFKPNSEKHFSSNDKIAYYINFSIFENSTGNIVENVILSSFFSSFHTNLDVYKEYFIIIKGGVYPDGFYLQVLTQNHSIEAMSYNTYLKKYMGFNSVNFKIDHPIIEKDKFYLIGRLIFKCSNSDQKFRISLKYSDRYAKRLIEIFCYNNKSLKKIRIYPNEIIAIKKLNADLESNTSNMFYFTISVKPTFFIAENSIEVEFLYTDSATSKVELVDHIEPYEIYDRYHPNKYGIIFKEFIFNPDIVFSSLDIKIRKDTLQNEIEKTRMFVELFRLSSNCDINSDKTEKEFIYRWDFFDNITIDHLIFDFQSSHSDTKKSNSNTNSNISIFNTNRPYLLVCNLYINEMSSYVKSFYEESNISWIIRIFSSDTLGFVKDTTKEDSEKALKDFWEISETGRSEKAHKSRLKYILQTRKKNGDLLSPEEEKLLTEERQRKPLLVNNPEVVLSNKKNITKKPEQKEKINLSGKKIAIPDNSLNNPSTHLVNNKSMLIPTKPLPLPETHTSKFVKEFIVYNYKERTVVLDNELDQFEKLIIDENMTETKHKEIEGKVEEYFHKISSITHEIQNKADLNESLKVLCKTATSFRKEEKEYKDQLIKAREIIKNDIQNRIDIETSIIGFIKFACTGEPCDIYKLTAAVNLYTTAKNILNNKKNEIKMIENLFETISSKKEEFLKNELKKLSHKDKNTIHKYLEEIKLYQWKISQEIINKLNDLIK